ncbi:MAG: LamG domain-containing protein [Planctomycetota bacterium]|nr:LamG domain-containing protein [Planctomycetota bacterium]
MTATFSQDIYELGDTLELTITGEPGAWTCILFDTQLGTYSIPGLITFDLAKSPSFSVIDLGPLPPSGQLVLSLPTDCGTTLLTQTPIHVQVAMFPTANPLPACMSNVASLLIGNGDCDVCPAAAQQDASVSALPGGMALHLPGAGGDYYFESQGELAENGDGTATLRGVLASLASPGDRFLLNVRLSGRLDRKDAAFPPIGSPNKKLLAPAYVENGGPIDPENWHYYTELEGDLVGLDALAGAYVTIEDFGGAVQFGMGASGKNLFYGACAGLDAKVVSQPSAGVTLVDSSSSELTIEIGQCPPPFEDVCVDPSQPTGHILWWPEVSKHFMALTDGVTFEEYADGTAHLFGTVAVQGEPDKCFELDVHFSDRVDNGDANFPPTDSPKWGDVDPASADETTWHYYQKTEGMLLGCGDFVGAVIALDRMGPSFQVGVGANYHDLDYGGSGWLNLTVLEQPTSGTTFNVNTTGDINLDFKNCPAPSAEPVVHYDFSGQAGTQVLDQRGDLDLVFDAADGSLQWVTDGALEGVRFLQGSGEDTCIRRPDGASNLSLLDALQKEGNLTVQALVRQDAAIANDSRIVSFSSSTTVGDRNFSLMSYPTAGGVQGQVRLSTGKGTLDKEFDATWKAGELAVVAMTYGQDGVVRAFHNGSLVASFVHGDDFSSWTDRPFVLGNEFGGDRPFHGEMFDVKIWNRALSAGELLDEAGDLIGTIPTPPTAAPIAHWDFSSQTGDKVLDQVGSVDLDFDGDDFDWVTDSHGMGLEFEKDNSDMLKSASTSSAAGLRQAIQASNALTLQVFYSQDKGSDDDARLFSWSSGTDVTNRNLSMISTWNGSSFSGELRVKTSSSTSEIHQGLGVGEDVAVVYTMTFDATTGVVRSYLDGQLIGTDSHAGDLSNWSDHKLRLGNESGGKRSFEGVMYDVKLWDTALDDAAVLDAANGLLGL